MSDQGAAPIRVAIAGQGRSGFGIHAAWLRKDTETYAIVAAADQLPERRAEIAEATGARVYDDWAAMLGAGGCDLFVNALPSPLHQPATIAALDAGYAVVCEKPMAPTVAAFDQLVAAAERNRQWLLPFQNNRLQPFFQQMLAVVRSGVLGEILHVRSVWGGFDRRWDWQTIQCNWGGALFNTGPHAIDQALLLFGDREDPQVFCRMACRHELGGDADDFCAVTLYGHQSPQVEVLLSQYQAYPPEDMYVISGTRGGLTGGPSKLRWRYYDAAQVPRPAFWNTWSEQRQYPRETLPWVEETWTVPTEIAGGGRSGYTLPSFQIGVKSFYDNVAEVLRGQAQPLITLPQVRRQIAVFEECHRQNPLPRLYSRWVPGEGPVA